MPDLNEFAEKYFSADMDKAVPLGLLRAWLSENHWHPEPDGDLDPFEESDSRPVVDSLSLDEWAKSVAVTRVVDHGPYGSYDKEVWNFFEHGWHKAGPACETHMIQSRARIVKVYPKTSSTTGREHMCELPPEETCYWSGDPYAPHEMGF